MPSDVLAPSFRPGAVADSNVSDSIPLVVGSLSGTPPSLASRTIGRADDVAGLGVVSAQDSVTGIDDAHSASQAPASSGGPSASRVGLVPGQSAAGGQLSSVASVPLVAPLTVASSHRGPGSDSPSNFRNHQVTMLAGQGNGAVLTPDGQFPVSRTQVSDSAVHPPLIRNGAPSVVGQPGLGGEHVLLTASHPSGPVSDLTGQATPAGQGLIQAPPAVVVTVPVSVAAAHSSTAPPALVGISSQAAASSSSLSMPGASTTPQSGQVQQRPAPQVVVGPPSYTPSEFSPPVSSVSFSSSPYPDRGASSIPRPRLFPQPLTLAPNVHSLGVKDWSPDAPATYVHRGSLSVVALNSVQSLCRDACRRASASDPLRVVLRNASMLIRGELEMVSMHSACVSSGSLFFSLTTPLNSQERRQPAWTQICEALGEEPTAVPLVASSGSLPLAGTL